MIRLSGFAVSNYYNKVKLVLLEKEIPFQEELMYPTQKQLLLERSPSGKIPVIATEQGYLSESQAILEYLEEAYPEKPLYPTDTFERAKCRELILHLESNVELNARRLYKEAFFGGTVSAETKDEVREKLEIGLQCLSRMAKFSPYILGSQLTVADCAAWAHLGVIARAIQVIYGEDLSTKHLSPVTDYLQGMGSRPQVQKVAADRTEAYQAFFNRMRRAWSDSEA